MQGGQAYCSTCMKVLPDLDGEWRSFEHPVTRLLCFCPNNPPVVQYSKSSNIVFQHSFHMSTCNTRTGLSVPCHKLGLASCARNVCCVMAALLNKAHFINGQQ